MNDYNIPASDEEEFIGILKCLDGKELAILHQVLKKDGEKEQKICLRQLINDNNVGHDGKIHNAYFARVLVTEPIVHIKEEIVCRFIKTFIE